MAKWIEVKVKPSARESSLREGESGIWIARLKSPPVNGKANKELIGLLAKAFGVRKTDITIKTGASSRLKRVQIGD